MHRSILPAALVSLTLATACERASVVRHEHASDGAQRVGSDTHSLDARGGPLEVVLGTDLNAVDNPFVQPQDPIQAGGGRNQSLRGGDVLFGTVRDEVIFGGLGPDVLAGRSGDDVLVGGTEAASADNSDRAFGQFGDDVFIWQPGDGSDLFDGGPGVDAIMFGILGSYDGSDSPRFQLVNDGQFAQPFIDPSTSLPVVDVRASPGFCDVVDGSADADAAALQELDLDNLVRFSLRAVADAFEAGQQRHDNGLRVTLHLRDVEFVVCTVREGGELEIFDLRSTPATRVDVDALPRRVQQLLR